ncbi:hypothetical protein VNI00_007324 [Paramarasmius palmivorus]|uniref:HMG box domain-containing protein n=1 Tax=Paramarasmius palmivorus TaxID=297713 RepID=A0AAW0D4C8_9AGAR
MAITQATKAPRKKTTKPPGHIPRPPNAFIFFRKDFLHGQPEVQPFLHLAMVPESDRDNTHVQTNISKQASRIWEQMKSADKVHWFRMQEEAKRKHREKYPNYKFRPQRKEKKQRERTTRLPVATTDLMPHVEKPFYTAPHPGENLYPSISASSTPVSNPITDFPAFNTQGEPVDYFSFPHLSSQQPLGPPSYILDNRYDSAAAALFDPQQYDTFSGQTAEAFHVPKPSSAYVPSFNHYDNYAGPSHNSQRLGVTCIDPRLLTFDQSGPLIYASSIYGFPGECSNAEHSLEIPQPYSWDMNFGNGL